MSSTGTIAQVVPAVDPRFGGTSVSVPALARAMHARDARTKLFFAHASSRQVDWPDYFLNFADDWPGVFRSSRSLNTALQATDCSVVHHHALWLPSLGYAHRAATRHGAPLVISPRGMLSPYARRRSRLKKWFAHRVIHPGALRQAAGWHATSEQERDNIHNAGFTQPIVVAANGFDPPVWNKAHDRAAWLARFPELTGKRILLFFARWHSKKGLDWLIHWWGERHRSFPDWHLLIAGQNDEWTGAELKALAARRGIAARVTIAATNDLAKPYALAQVYVLPTLSENFGLTVAEALSAGIPVATTSDAPWQALNELGAGACVPRAELGNALARLLSLDETELSRMGKAGQAFVTANFSWDRQAALLLDFYQTLN
ncbi:MAG: glycosyltransferase [Planctomycetes bacterium]|nr:glycosyltransferase [Planctomycetota bacterium]